MKSDLLLQMPGIVAFWDFQTISGEPLVSRGPHACCLREENGPPKRVAGGVFGPQSLRFTPDGVRQGGYLRAGAVGSLGRHAHGFVTVPGLFGPTSQDVLLIG